MRSYGLAPAALLAAALLSFGCARNRDDTAVGAARDTSTTVAADSARNQTESGVTDSSGQSTLGTGVEKTRPDQGQPVTSKGDTINPAVDSSTTSGSTTGSTTTGSNTGSSTTGSTTTDSSNTGSMTTDSSNTGSMTSDSSNMGSMTSDSSTTGGTTTDSSTTNH
jgi:hypothetical protein